MSGEGELASVGRESESAGLAEDDRITRDVKGKLLAGVDHLPGAEVDVHRRRSPWPQGRDVQLSRLLQPPWFDSLIAAISSFPSRLQPDRSAG